MSSASSSRTERWIPGLRAVRTYRRAWLRSDLLAGVVLAAILVPQGMAYAQLAGLPAVTGLYTTIACLVGYAACRPIRPKVRPTQLPSTPQSGPTGDWSWSAPTPSWRQC